MACFIAVDSSDVHSVQTFTKELNFFPRLRSAAFDLLAVLLSEDESLRDALLVHSCGSGMISLLFEISQSEFRTFLAPCKLANEQAFRGAKRASRSS